MIDISRDPRWGRVAESLGEDPYLTSVLGAAMVRGFQGEGLARADSLVACAKHYAGYGAAEGGRDYNSAWIPEILLRELYLRPFCAARDAGVGTFMTSFNTVNGIPVTGNRFLLRNILRHEWKFDGMVVSDYQAISELIAHGYATGPRDAARACECPPAAECDRHLPARGRFRLRTSLSTSLAPRIITTIRKAHADSATGRKVTISRRAFTGSRRTHTRHPGSFLRLPCRVRDVSTLGGQGGRPYRFQVDAIDLKANDWFEWTRFHAAKSSKRVQRREPF